MTPAEKEKGHTSDRISYLKEKNNVESRTKISSSKKENKLRLNPSRMQKISLGTFLIFVVLLSLLISIIAYGSIGFYQKQIDKIQYTIHIKTPPKINRIFTRNMQRAAQGLNPASGAGGGGFWNTVKKVTGTSLTHVQQRNMSAYSVYHKVLPKKPTKEQTPPENSTNNEVLSQPNVNSSLEIPPVAPIKHPAIVVDDENLLDHNYIPNMRLTHTPPSEVLQKKYGFKVLVCQLLGFDQAGKKQYLIGTDRSITLAELKKPGKSNELTIHFFGPSGPLDPTSPNYARWSVNRENAQYVQRLLVAFLKYEEFATLKNINDKQLKALEKNLAKIDKDNEKIKAAAAQSTNTNTSINNIKNNENNESN